MKKYFFFLVVDMIDFRKRGREGEGQGEKHRSVASCSGPDWGPNHNPGMFPDRELNWHLFTLQKDAPQTDPHRPGRKT